MTLLAVALIAIGLLVTVVIFIRKPAEHRRAHVTVAELQARLADESGPEHARAGEEDASARTGAEAGDFGSEPRGERDRSAADEIGPEGVDEVGADADRRAEQPAADAGNPSEPHAADDETDEPGSH